MSGAFSAFVFCMFSKDSFSIIPGDRAWQERERVRKRREYTLQAALLLVLAIVIAAIATNVESNLAVKHIRSGFGFLSNPAGFEISDRMIEYGSRDPFWKAFLVGLLNTLKVSAWAILSSTVLGILVGLMRLAKNPLIRFFGAAHVEAYRNVPLLVLLLALYLAVTELLPGVRQALHFGNWVYLSKSGLLFAVPQWGVAAVLGSMAVGAVVAYMLYRRLCRTATSLVSGFAGFGAFILIFLVAWVICGAAGGWNHPIQSRFSMSGGLHLTPEFLTLWLGLTLFTSASIAEIVRAGVQSVRGAQWDAALALGLTRGEAVSYVIFPQALRLIVPPLASQYMSLTKNSSLAVMVGYSDLVNIGTTAMNVTGQALEVICIIMSVYLVVNLVTSWVMNRFNARIMMAPQ